MRSNPISFGDPLGLKRVFTVYVDQPGSGGDNDTYEVGLGGVDVGHTFIELTDTDTGEKISRGFYPSTGVNPLRGIIQVPGTVINDGGHKFDVKKEYILTPTQYDNAKRLITKDALNPPQYNLNTFNCTDWTEKISSAAGQTIPDTRGKWPGGQGSNPGQLGEILRTLP